MTEQKDAAVDDRIKFLVVVADCEEARLAAFFAGRRARNSDASIILAQAIEPPEFGHFASVAETMRAEAQDHAEALMREFAAEVKAQHGEDPTEVIREGTLADTLRALIEEDPKIALLFLGASADESGPGPLVTSLAKKPTYLSARPIPVVVVPGSATRDELRVLAG